jgi:DNA-binding transcriptional ArsR family regulator
MEDEEKITLDMKAFKTLASDSRIGILKSLDERRKTLTELSKRFGLSASTVKEHMDKLSEAGLVRLVDDGHKWKYYELTRKGSRILHPGTTKIWVMLAVSIFGAFYMFWDIIRQSHPLAAGTGEFAAQTAGKGAEVIGQPGVPEAVGEVAAGAAETAVPLAGLPLLNLLGLVVFSIAAGLAVASLFHAKRQPRV